MTDIANVRPWEIPTKLARVRQAYQATTPVSRVDNTDGPACVATNDGVALLPGNDDRLQTIRELFDSNEPQERLSSADTRVPVLGRFVDVTA